MADQISRPRSGVPPGQKEENKKRLTNLNGWTKSGGEGSDTLEGKHKGGHPGRACLLACLCLPAVGSSYIVYFLLNAPLEG